MFVEALDHPSAQLLDDKRDRMMRNPNWESACDYLKMAVPFFHVLEHNRLAVTTKGPLLFDWPKNTTTCIRYEIGACVHVYAQSLYDEGDEKRQRSNFEGACRCFAEAGAAWHWFSERHLNRWPQSPLQWMAEYEYLANAEWMRCAVFTKEGKKKTQKTRYGLLEGAYRAFMKGPWEDKAAVVRDIYYKMYAHEMHDKHLGKAIGAMRKVKGPILKEWEQENTFMHMLVPDEVELPEPISFGNIQNPKFIV